MSQKLGGVDGAKFKDYAKNDRFQVFFLLVIY